MHRIIDISVIPRDLQYEEIPEYNRRYASRMGFNYTGHFLLCAAGQEFAAKSERLLGRIVNGGTFWSTDFEQRSLERAISEGKRPGGVSGAPLAEQQSEWMAFERCLALASYMSQVIWIASWGWLVVSRTCAVGIRLTTSSFM
jgi:hypothetical protein